MLKARGSESQFLGRSCTRSIVLILFAMNGAGWPSSVHTMDGVGAPVEVQERVTDGGTPSITDITESLLAVVVASTAQ